MDNKAAKELIIKYNAGQCTEAEKAMLDQWYMQLDTFEPSLSKKQIEILRKQVQEKLPGQKNSVIKLWTIIAAVAAVSVFGASTWMFTKLYEKQANIKLVQDIAPGSNKAVLTLSNGKTINLSAQKFGVVINSGRLSYSDGTSLAEDVASNSKSSGSQNISIPRGGQYQIILSDGTKVWLNSETSLEYPANFKGQAQRKVNLKYGEAYFEVAKDKTRPFIVRTLHQDVLVLGTHFNINAYESAFIRTTLSEGSVQITLRGKHRSGSVKISPGEQSVCSKEIILFKPVDPDLEIAWKNGKIEFRDADLKTIMEMLKRWYDIEIVYPEHIPDAQFSGSVSRYRNISEVLELLQSTGEVHFKIKGRRVEILR